MRLFSQNGAFDIAGTGLSPRWPFNKKSDPAAAEAPPIRHEVVDRSALTRAPEQGDLVVGSASAHEILDVLILSLIEQPTRTDLWLMRFEMQRALGLKADFARDMQQAFASYALRKELDWQTVRRLWEELAPGETPPGDVILPAASGAAATTKQADTVPAATRRFSDFAMRESEHELAELTRQYQVLRAQPDFLKDFARETARVLNRPTPLQHAMALEREVGGSARIFLKRGDQHDNTPETELAVAQCYIATRLGRKKIITGNDVYEFSLSLTKAAAAFGLTPTVVVSPKHLGEEREITLLRKLGAQVESWGQTDGRKHDAREGALKLWQRSTGDTHLALSFGTGPNPFPRMISDFQMLLGLESDLQLRAEGSGRPRVMVAAVHSEADALGFMLPYLKRPDVELYYAEAKTTKHDWKPSARLRAYNGAKREHAWLRATDRITHIPEADYRAERAQESLLRLENISIGLEDGRAVAVAIDLALADGGDRDIVVLAK